jgi:hypothetical protein
VEKRLFFNIVMIIFVIALISCRGSLTGNQTEMIYALDDFGAEGDGVVSDTEAYLKAVEKATATGAQTIYLTEGKTYFFDVTDIEELPGIGIIGNGATIRLNGAISFEISGLSRFRLENLTIKSSYYENEDTLESQGSLFYSDSTEAISVDIHDFRFIGTAANDDSAVNRYPKILDLPQVTAGTIEDVHFDNVGTCISLGGYSRNISLRNIEGSNVQTLVYVREGSTSLTFENLNIENTLAQQATWISKNTTAKENNGMDTLLIESSPEAPTTGLVLKNIRGTNCVERVIYCQGSDVRAYDLFAQDTGGFKFVGSAPSEGVSSNVEIFGATMIVTDNSLGGNSTLTQHYWIDDVVWHDVFIDNRRTDQGSLGQVFNIVDGVGMIMIDGLTVNNMHSGSPLILFSGPSKGDVDTLAMRNVIFQNMSSKNSSEILWGFYNSDRVAYSKGSVGHLIIENVRGSTSPDLVADSDFGRVLGDLSNKITSIEVSDVSLSLAQYFPAFELKRTDDTSNIRKLEFSSILDSALSSNEFDFSSASQKYLTPNFKGSVQGAELKIAEVSGTQLELDIQNESALNKRLTDCVKSLHATFKEMRYGSEWTLPVNFASGIFQIEVETSLGSFSARMADGVLTERSNSNPDELTVASVADKFSIVRATNADGSIILKMKQGYPNPLGVNITIKKIQ